MTLLAPSLSWAIDFIRAHSDGDLFPKILEVDAIAEEKEHFISQLVGADLSNLPPGSCRRFIVPKDEISYRQATQLDPQDSIILSAIVHQFGQQIENLRRPKSQVFSYRFQPSTQDGLYNNRTSWNDFWTTASKLARSHAHILYCDIADFYNQINHHTVENQLIAAGFPNAAIRWVITLLESTTALVSRGVPVGPHAIHLIAEATLTPIDNSLAGVGIKFIRYADDILIFCKSARAAKVALATVATTLDKQQRLVTQRHKTRFYEPQEFQALCSKMIEDRPISADESTLLRLIKKYSHGNPYATISLSQVSEEDLNTISNDSIRAIIEDYMSQEPIDYIRLRWLYRRLSQIGHHGAIEISLENLDTLGPCFANICFYLASVKSLPSSDWKRIGSRLLTLLRTPEVKASEYFRLMLLSLFTRNAHINHFSKLRQLFQHSDSFVRREIILASRINGAPDWVRELREDFQSMDPWQQRAMLFAMSGLARDEKRYFLARQPVTRPFEKTLVKWAKRDAPRLIAAT